MLKKDWPAIRVLMSCVMAAAALPAVAQFAPPGLPKAELIRDADKYEPPKLTEYAAKLARQPDMSGLWYALEPLGIESRPVFDPLHVINGKPQVQGEATYGPTAGTHLTGIPYTAEYQKKYDEYVKEALKGNSRDDFAACVPYGVPRMIGDSPVPFDIIQSPEVMFWYNDYGRSERRIFLDGRKHPTTPAITGEFGPTYSGHSIGHWEGNTLVVETAGMLGNSFDGTSAPYSDQLSMVERLRLIDTNVLESQMTFSDPVAFTKPWVVTRYFQRISGAFGPPAADSGTSSPAGGPAAPTQAATPLIPRAYLNLNDRPCVPNVEMDEDGYERAILPAELEARNAAKAKAAAAARKKKR